MSTKTDRNSVQTTVRNLRKNFLPLLLTVAGTLMGGTSFAQTTATWDVNGATTGTGGTGTWNASNTFWTTDGGATFISITNGAYNYLFAGTAGSVSIGGNVSGNQLIFGVTGYTLGPNAPYTLTATNGVVLSNSVNLVLRPSNGNTLTFAGLSNGITGGTGSSITLGGGDNNYTNKIFFSGGTIAASAPITVNIGTNSMLTIGSQSSSGLTVNATIANTSASGAPLNITNSAAGTISFNGVISGNNGLVVDNTSTGKIMFAAANTYAGGTTINSTNSSAQINYSNSLAFGSGTITVVGAGTNYIRAYDNALVVTNPLVISAGSTAWLNTAASTNKTTWAGTISGAGRIYYNYADAGLYLTATNSSFGGGFNYGSSGTLYVSKLGMAGSNSSIGTNKTITVGSSSGTSAAGTIRWIGASDERSDKDFALTTGSTATSAGLTIYANGATNATLTLDGNIDSTGTNNKVITFIGNANNTTIMNGLINQTSGFTNSLTVGGSSTFKVVLANSNNSFSGPVSISQSTGGQYCYLLTGRIGNKTELSPLGAGGIINIGSSTATTNTAWAFLKYTGAGETSDKVINLAGTVAPANLVNSGTGRLKFTTAVTVTGAGVKTFYVDQDIETSSTEFAGEIPNSSGGTTALNKNGAGTLILSAANTFTGGFSLKGGTLELRHAQSLAAANALTFTTGGTGLGRVKVAYPGTGSDLGNLLLLVDGTIDLGTDSTAQLRFGTATGWTADKILTVANSTGGGKLYILDTNNVALSQIKSLENPTYTASLAANGLLTFTAPAPANTPPTITSGGAFSVSENIMAVTTVTATDAEGNALSYSISGGADADKFWIDSGTGVLTFLSAPNFESPTDTGADNIYNVTVQVTDGALTGTKDIAVTVTNVSDSPADFKADWLAANGLPGSSNWSSDPNNVGYSLATAYAFGLSPSVNSGAPVTLASSSAGSVKIVYLQKDNSGVIYTVKSGTDLAAGLSGTVAPVVSAVQPSPGKSGYTQYEATYTPGGSKGFLKVQADVP